MTAQATEHLLLQMQGIGKAFPGVKALEGVHLSVRAGQVHALLARTVLASPP